MNEYLQKLQEYFFNGYLNRFVASTSSVTNAKMTAKPSEAPLPLPGH